MTERQLRRVNLPPTPVSVRRMQTLQAQILVIQKEYPSLRWYVLSDGSCFYDAEEDVVSLFSSNLVLKEQKKGVIRLPAPETGIRLLSCFAERGYVQYG
ncbi:MAG: hypothetical protein LBE17_05515 [Treponema sp.]|jgi:hypothetical protein|nr:hypothetical protein [Treponema sp.]